MSRKQIKRPLFRRFAVRNLVIFILIGVTCATVFTVLHKERYESDKKAEFEYYLEYVSSELDSAVKYSGGRLRNNLFAVEAKYLLCEMYDRYGVASKYYINQHAEADSSRSVFMKLTRYNGEESHLRLDTTSNINDFIEYSNGRFVIGDDDIKIGVRNYYINNDYGLFIPVQMEIAKVDPLTKGCTMIDYYASDVSRPQGTSFIFKTDNTTIEGLPSLLVMGDEGISSEYSMENFGSNDLSLIMHTVTSVNEYTYQTGLLHSQYKVPPYISEYWYLVVIVYGAAVLLAAFIALALAYVRYMTEMSVFNMIEYRRKTTNAMAHDLKTPLAAISAYAENLQQSIVPDKRQYYSAKIVENVSVMNRMIEEILEFSKSEEGRNMIAKEDVDITDLIDELKAEVKPLFDDNKVLLNSVIRSSVILKTDRALLKQSIQNLLTNAAKYSTPCTETEITVTRTKITITNSSDLDIRDVSKLKEPFVKGHDSRGEKDGTGLGLSIADNNLNMLGYKLEIDYSDGVFTATIVL